MASQTLDKLAKERERLLALISTLSDEALDRPHGDGWTIRETLTHLLNAEEDHCKVIALIARGDAERLAATTLELDTHNAQRLAERGSLEREALLAALAEQRARTHALFEKMSDEQLEMVGRHPALGETTVGKIFRIIGIHEKMHAQEIAAALQ